MKARNKKDYSNNWVQTVVAIVGLLFLILVNLGVLTPEESAEVQPLIASTLGFISSAIAGVIGVIGLFFKPSA